MTQEKTAIEEWVGKNEKKFIDMGYRKYTQSKFKSEDFVYWKTFKEDGKPIYQIGILVYDFTKYGQEHRISSSYECLLLGKERENRVDLSVSDSEMQIERFEIIARIFYEALNQFSR